MSKNSGYLVEFTNKDQKLQLATLKFIDQNKAFQNKEKALITLLDDKFREMLDGEGKPIRILKSLSFLTIKGYTD